MDKAVSKMRVFCVPCLDEPPYCTYSRNTNLVSSRHDNGVIEIYICNHYVRYPKSGISFYRIQPPVGEPTLGAIAFWVQDTGDGMVSVKCLADDQQLPKSNFLN